MSAALERVAAGDLAALREVLSTPHEQLLAESAGLDLVVTRDSLALVLRTLDQLQGDPAEAQQWASFVRRGYVAGEPNVPITPVAIAYEASYEELIAEAVGRLDEIGDVIDGESPSTAETRDWLARLEPNDQTDPG